MVSVSIKSSSFGVQRHACMRLLEHAEECGVTASLLRWSRLIVVWSVTLLSGPSLVAAPTGTAQEGATDGL